MSDYSGPQGIQILEIPNVSASQLYAGEKVDLATSALLRVLLVTIDLEHPQATIDDKKKAKGDEHAIDLWLVLSIGDDISLPIPESQPIKPQRKTGVTSYTVPSQEVEGASLQITLPPQTPRNSVKRFEQILSQYSAYEDDDRSDIGTVELTDENGKVLGTIQGDFQVKQGQNLSALGNEKTPVLIDLLPDGSNDHELHVELVGKGEANDKTHWMIKSANFVSDRVVKGSEFIGGKITNAVDNYTTRSPAAGSGATTPVSEGGLSPFEKPPPQAREPVKFKPATTKNIATIQQWSGQVVQVSSKTTGAILNVASNVGNRIGKKTGIQRKTNPDGTPGPEPTGIRGFVNRTLIATNTVMDGIDAGAQNLLYSSSGAATKVVGHRYGDEAKTVSESVFNTGRNVFLVYKDIRGVRRTALLKMAGGTMMKATLKDGREVVLELGEKGQLQPVQPAAVQTQGLKSSANASSPLSSAGGYSTPPSGDLSNAPPRRQTGISPQHTGSFGLQKCSTLPPPAHPSRSTSTSPVPRKN